MAKNNYLVKIINCDYDKLIREHDKIAENNSMVVIQQAEKKKKRALWSGLSPLFALILTALSLYILYEGLFPLLRATILSKVTDNLVEIEIVLFALMGMLCFMIFLNIWHLIVNHIFKLNYEIVAETEQMRFATAVHGKKIIDYHTMNRAGLAYDNAEVPASLVLEDRENRDVSTYQLNLNFWKVVTNTSITYFVIDVNNLLIYIPYTAAGRLNEVTADEHKSTPDNLVLKQDDEVAHKDKKQRRKDRNDRKKANDAASQVDDNGVTNVDLFEFSETTDENKGGEN